MIGVKFDFNGKDFFLVNSASGVGRVIKDDKGRKICQLEAEINVPDARAILGLAYRRYRAGYADGARSQQKAVGVMGAK